jgi:hypothetical protein
VYNEGSKILCPEKQQIFKYTSLCANMVAEHMNDLSRYIQYQLKEKCKNFVARAIDKSTDVKDIAQLAVFVRVNEDFELLEELLELFPVKGKTGADEIFSQLVTLLNKFELPWGKMVGSVSDGAPAMIGKNNGAAAKLKTQNERIRGNDFFP